MRITLTREAGQRLAALVMTRWDVAPGEYRHLPNLDGQNRRQGPIDDETLKGDLAQLSTNRRQSTIR